MFQLKCPIDETSNKTHELQLISGIQQEDVEVCGLTVFEGITLVIG